MDIAMGHHKGSVQWVTDTVIVHHPLMDTDIVMDLQWVMDIVTALDHLLDTDTAIDLKADTDTAMDHPVDTDTAMDLKADTDTAIPPPMDTDMATSTVLVHLPLIVTTPSMDILMVISTKNLKFFKWQMLNQLLFNQSPIPFRSSKILSNQMKDNW